MATEVALENDGFTRLSKSALGGKLLLVVGIAAVIAVMAVFWLWSQKPEYRVLFSNYSDKDGGAIVASLEQLNIPFKFSESGTAILVPAAQVHETRLKLASQGLPKGGNVGFELLENQKFGVSQFVEQVNFQRALEGELERSIQAVEAVQVARVHLAIPKASVFVRDQLKPTASVLLNLHPGRTLDARQVSAIVHLVASSVPELEIANVTIVDQNGNLLSDTSKQNSAENIDPSKLKYIDEVQKNIVKRVESIITPLVGANNVRAEASAEIDFSTTEQAAESYKPNQAPDTSAIRSTQLSEAQSTTPATTGGVPGALSNQPPAPATAPITTNAPATGTNGAVPTTPSSSQKNATTNYEVDKTVRYVQQPMGGIKRLNVAVVVNFKTEIDKKGKSITRALTEAEKTQISDLAKQAMGFSQERGDALSVVNSSFADIKGEQLPEVPLWKQAENIELAKEAVKLLAGLAVLFFLYSRLLKPMLRTLTGAPDPAALPDKSAEGKDANNQNVSEEIGEDAVVRISNEAEKTMGNDGERLPSVLSYQKNLEATKLIAKENPKLVANVVTAWVSGND
ncbi:MAG: flagellar M-ring protein FliF [Methylophilaceae bacterium]|nr:flagellar M-ring protein FliF [Methylophilaceae bacterium]